MKFDPSCRSGKLRCGMQHPLRASPHETFSRVINKVPVKTLIALAVSVLGVTIETSVPLGMCGGTLSADPSANDCVARVVYRRSVCLSSKHPRSFLTSRVRKRVDPVR